MAMASNIIQIRRTSCQSKQQRVPLSPAGAELHGFYGRDSGDGSAVLELLLSTRLGNWLHMVQP